MPPGTGSVAGPASGPKAKAEPAAAFKSPETKQPAAKTAKPSLEDKNRPAGIERPAAVDDLKLISGVGPTWRPGRAANTVRPGQSPSHRKTLEFALARRSHSFEVL